MQQQERGGSSEERKQQDRRLKTMQGGTENQQQQEQPQPQKCPRCESLNTKFCYYNNYSLSQPRYFCKTCRRYWTQGGTLRNVPVGGGCRKGKRTKTSSVSGEASRASQPPQPPSPPHPNLTTTQQNILSSSNPVITTGPPVLRTKLEPAAAPPSMGSYYPSGGFLSSLAAIQSQSFNPQPLHQAFNVGGADHHHNIGGSSNLDLLQGFSTVPSFGSSHTQHQQIQQPKIYHHQMGNIDKSVNPMHMMYHTIPSDQENLTIQSRRPGSSTSHHQQHDWHQQGSFINNSNNPNVPDHDTSLWSISTASANSNNTNTASVSGSLNPNQWRDLPGYGPPP